MTREAQFSITMAPAPSRRKRPNTLQFPQAPLTNSRYNETSPIPAPFTPLYPCVQTTRSSPEYHTHPSSSTNQTENYFYNQVAAIVANGSNYTTKCEKCLASTNVFHEAAISQPVSVVTDLLIRVCVSPPVFTRGAISAY